MKTTLLILPLCIAAALPAAADENLWLYTRGTDTRPQGTWELKIMEMARLDKDSGSYAFHELRPELEYGITDRLTISGSPIIFHHDYQRVEWAPMVDTQGGPEGSFEKTQLGGFEVGFKYNVLSPYKDPIGISLGLAYEHRYAYRLDGADISQDSLVPRIHIQKNWLDDTLTWTFTGKVEFERRKSPGVIEDEIAFDLSTGLAYRFAPRWFVGLEARYQADFLSPEIDGVIEGKRSSWEWNDWRLGDQFQYGLYVGPTLHYSGENWWATAGALMQVQGWSADGDAASRGGRNWDEHERWHIGLTVGFEFGGPKTHSAAEPSGKSSRRSK